MVRREIRSQLKTQTESLPWLVLVKPVKDSVPLTIKWTLKTMWNFYSILLLGASELKKVVNTAVMVNTAIYLNVGKTKTLIGV